MTIDIRDPTTLAIVAAALVFAALLVASLFRRFRKPLFVPGEQIALIEEDAETTAIGGISLAALLLIALLAASGFTAASTVLQQIAALAFGIGGAIVCSTGIIVGRRRRYRVYRARQAEE